jgi:twitching motility protein PilT
MAEETGNPYPHIDRRQAVRKRTQSTMRYRVLGEARDAAHEVVTADISAKAVLFESRDLIAIGTDMHMELIIPSLEKPIEAEGRINRIGEREKGQSYRYCLLFEKITEEDQRTLESYIRLIDIDHLLKLAMDRNASDVHLVANKPPIFRVDGQLKPLDLPPIAPGDLRSMILTMMSEKQQSQFEHRLELNFSYYSPGGNRFRVNAHFEKGFVEAALRIIPAKIKSFEELGLPPALDDFVQKSRGLILVGGSASSGKTTTLAALVDAINRERRCMVVGIEDPIEYLHPCRQSIIKQREVGTDTLSFAEGLRQVLRQDPDVIFVGDLRDRDSVSLAVTAAETGHLVLAAMYATDAMESINRLVDLFPREQHEQVRHRLAGCLEGVMAQMLLPRRDGKGRVAATELVAATHTMKKMIREGKHDQVESYVKSGLQMDFHSMDESLKSLVQTGMVDAELARSLAKNPGSMKAQPAQPGLVPV